MKKEKESERESHSNVTERWFSKAPALHSRLWASLKFYRRSARPRSIYENALPRFMENTSQRGVDGVIWKRVELTASTAYSYRLPSLLGGLCARSIVCWRGTVNRMDHFPVVLMFITSPGAEWDWVAYFSSAVALRPVFKANVVLFANHLEILLHKTVSESSQERLEEADSVDLSKLISAAWYRHRWAICE